MKNMKEVWLVHDIQTNKFIVLDDDARPQLVERKQAKLVDSAMADFVAKVYYKRKYAPDRFNIIEATSSEYLAHIGRKGGRKRSIRKTRAARRNAQFAGRKPTKKKKPEDNHETKEETANVDGVGSPDSH